MDDNTPPPSDRRDDTAAPHAVYGAAPANLRGTRKRTLGTWLWPIVILAVVAVGVLYIIGHNGDAPAKSQGGGRRGGGNGFTPVDAVTAELGDMPIYLDALGTVTPTATVTVHTQVSGVLQSINFTEGQMVTKGQFLAQVDPRPYQAALMQAEGNLARDQAQLAAARVDLNRYRTLLSQDSISQQQVDTQAATVEQLEGTVKADQANVATQNLNLTYAHITAPISGRAGLRQVDPGNYVSTGDSNGIVAITQQSPIDVAFTIPEDQVQTVTGRFHGGNTLTVSVMDRAQSKTLASGQLLSLDNLIDTTTGTLRAKARFGNADGALFPSQFVNVRILVDTLHNIVVVPSSAVLRGPQGLFVYVADKRGAVHVTPVQTGPAADDKTAILSGVEAGQVVVTDGTDRLREGACVALPGQSPNMGQFGKRRNGGQSGSQNSASASSASSSSSSSSDGGFFGHLFGGSSSSAAAGGKGKGGSSPCGGGSGSGHKHGQGQGQGGQAGAPAMAGSETNGPAAPAESPGGWKGKHGSDASTGSGNSGQTGQDNSQGGGHGGGGGRMAGLLKQLDLTPDQQTKVDAIMADARQQAQGSDDPDARHAAMQAAMQKVQAILTPAQKARLQQLRAAQDSGQGQAQ
ncbi:MdtA/MuxA family multidrug efflux RND transporter periplasmic adaptor subunit [Asticcacaulis solisilvae]|uniref:MdtA/MuxA family multidrug efflux RND transporter periplasmic adaptor subunit n=1 Tax=Asticcacaulis solisilvae TaxID=1217274 RepID=UPI003FD8E313